MEGISSRTGRQSSRYGSAAVFTGPVRRWQKQWVHVSSSSSSVTYNHSNKSNSSGNNNNISAVRIRRWTPVPSAQSGGDSESVAEERPRRKLRYTPIVVLESKKKEAENSDVDVKEASKTSQSAAQGASGDDNEKKISNNGLAAKTQASQNSTAATKDLNNRPMDLDTSEDDGDDDEDHDLGGADKDKAADCVKAAHMGFAC